MFIIFSITIVLKLYYKYFTRVIVEKDFLVNVEVYLEVLISK